MNIFIHQTTGRNYCLMLTISETLEIQTQFQWNINRYLHTTDWTVWFRMTFCAIEWLSEILNDMKRRAVSLRQLSYLEKKLPSRFANWHKSTIMHGRRLITASMPVS